MDRRGRKNAEKSLGNLANEEAKTGPATDQKLFTINMPHHRFIWLFVGVD